MLQMPPIQRRDIERLKGTRAIRIERTAPAPNIAKDHPEPVVEERRTTKHDRRKRDVPVANDRRRSRGRRLPRAPLNPKIRALLDNAEGRQTPVQGRFIDESV